MKFTPPQRWIAAFAAMMCAVAMFFPPWSYTYDESGNGGGHHLRPAGFHCIFSPPSPERSPLNAPIYAENYGVIIDGIRLLVECLIILTVGTALLIAESDTQVTTGNKSAHSPETPPQATSQPCEIAQPHGSGEAPMSLPVDTATTAKGFHKLY